MNQYLKILLSVLAALVFAQQGQARDNNETETQKHEYDEQDVRDLCSDDGTLFVDFSTLESALREVLEDARDAHGEDGKKEAEVKKWRIAGALNDGLQTVLTAACLILVIIALRKIDRLKRDTREPLRRQPETAAAPKPYPYSQPPVRRAPQSTAQASGTYSHPHVYQKPTEESQNSRPTPATTAKKQNRAETSSFKLYAEGQVGGGTLYNVNLRPEGKIYEIILSDENATTGTFRVNENYGIMENILNNYNSYLVDCEITANLSSNPSKIENTKPGKVERNPDGTWRVTEKAQVILH